MTKIATLEDKELMAVAIYFEKCSECGEPYVVSKSCPCCGKEEDISGLGDVCLACYINLLMYEIDLELDEVNEKLAKVYALDEIVEELLSD